MPKQPEASDNSGILGQALEQEIGLYRPWYEMAVTQRGRTTIGASGMEPEEMGAFLSRFISGTIPDNPRDDLELAYVVNLVIDDLKAYYMEAMSAQPGQQSIDSQTLNDWFWTETTAARTILKFCEVASQSKDPMLKMMGKALTIPSNQKQRVSS